MERNKIINISESGRQPLIPAGKETRGHVYWSDWRLPLRSKPAYTCIAASLLPRTPAWGLWPLHSSECLNGTEAGRFSCRVDPKDNSYTAGENCGYQYGGEGKLRFNPAYAKCCY